MWLNQSAWPTMSIEKNVIDLAHSFAVLSIGTNVVGQPVEKRADQALHAEHRCPFLGFIYLIAVRLWLRRTYSD
jgi:hypothetical protein